VHKNSRVIAPYILDPDKAINIWNVMFPNDKISIYDNDTEKFDSGKDKNYLNIISGATYGSSFVGMIHVKDTGSTQTQQDIEATATRMQAQLKLGLFRAGFLGKTPEKIGGGFTSDTGNQSLSLSSSQTYNSFINIVTKGIIPVIESDKLTRAVKTFADFDPHAMGEQLKLLKNNTGSEEGFNEAIEAARTGQQMVSIRRAEVETVFSSVAQADANENSVINETSLMAALTNYIDQCKKVSDEEGIMGVPINYYIKPITKSQIVKVYLNKHHSGEFESASGDDRKSTDQENED
jgi:hypothetical protein